MTRNSTCTQLEPERSPISLSVPSYGESTAFDPIIDVLIGYLEKTRPGALSDAVTSAYKQIPDLMDEMKVNSARSFLEFANSLLRWTPHENFHSKNVIDTLCMFYVIIDQPPLLELQTPINPDQVGRPLTWLSSWVVVYAQLIGLFMDTPASLTAESLQSFKDSPLYSYEEALVPEGGFRTFNQFFARHLKPGARPIDSPDDDRVIVYPTDCTYENSSADQNIVDIQSGGIVYIKGLPWTVDSLLQGSKYASEFEGGIWMHAFLNPYNYHRQHSPVSGKVLEARTIQGAAYFEVSTKNHPNRSILEFVAPDSPGYQFLQTRGLVVIDNPTLGKVAVLPIGMAMISSVKLSVKEGDVLKKGDDISCFLFGGSDIVCLFQAKAGLSAKDFVPSPEGSHSKMGTVLARAPL
ncbi:phosphatidylserine decarboxylase-domain-containing protein [Biscogniauxia marginata]|nr:phosphatidylserine decarboxylase-domain-containing protein [Biscogniauxia marginata]